MDKKQYGDAKDSGYYQESAFARKGFRKITDSTSSKTNEVYHFFLVKEDAVVNAVSKKGDHLVTESFSKGDYMYGFFDKIEVESGVLFAFIA